MPISIVLDGREAAVAETGAEAVELVRKLEAEQNRVERVVVSVQVDGEGSLDWEERLNQVSPQRVELSTVPLRVALAAAVDATLAELPRMGEGFCVAARLLREGEVAEAGRILLPLLGGLESYLALLQHLSRLDARCSSGAARTVACLDEGLETVLSAWGMGDFHRVSVVLEEVLATEVETGRGLLAEIRPLLQQED